MPLTPDDLRQISELFGSIANRAGKGEGETHYWFGNLAFAFAKAEREMRDAEKQPEPPK